MILYVGRKSLKTYIKRLHRAQPRWLEKSAQLVFIMADKSHRINGWYWYYYYGVVILHENSKKIEALGEWKKIVK